MFWFVFAVLIQRKFSAPFLFVTSLFSLSRQVRFDNVEYFPYSNMLQVINDHEFSSF